MAFLNWLGITAIREPIEVGNAAPDVATRDEQNLAVRTGDLYGDGFTLIYFYPRADTPGCTAQACSLRDDFAELQELGVRVIGVSSDSPGAQRTFKQKFSLPFTLLADRDHAVANAFGVRLIFGASFRQSFLIKNGRVIWRDLRASTRDQARDVLAALKKLS